MRGPLSDVTCISQMKEHNAQVLIFYASKGDDEKRDCNGAPSQKVVFGIVLNANYMSAVNSLLNRY